MAPSSPSKTRAVPSKTSESMPATLTTAPFGASDPVSTAMPPWTWIGSLSGWTTDAVGGGRVEGGQVLGHGPPGDGQAVAVQQPGVEQLPHHHRHPADAVEVGHVVAAVGLGVGQVGHPGGHPVEVVELQLDPGLVGDGQQVEHGVGGAAQGHGHGDGVLERLLGHDLAGPDPLPEQLDHGPAGGEGAVVAAAVDGRGRRAPRQRHAEGLGHRRHGVGGEHAGARSLGGAGVVLDEAQLLVGEGVRRRGPRPPRRPEVMSSARSPHAARAGSTRRRGTRSAG